MPAPAHPSVRRLFTGFATAAFIAWKLIVSIAITTIASAAIKNVVQLMDVRYTKSPFRQLFRPQALHRIGGCCFYCLEAYCRQCDYNDQQQREKEKPQTDIDVKRIII